MPAGFSAIRRYQPHAIWSTFPIATAHSIAGTLARMSKLPWIADFRDPMAQDDYPRDPATWRSYAKLEQRAIARAERATFTTPSAVEYYRRRYTAYASRFRLLENGYDEGTFSTHSPDGGPLHSGRITLLHSGVVYPEERDPTQLVRAIGELRKRAPEAYARLVVRFRAPVHEELIRELADAFGVADAVEVLPPLPYCDAIGEICRADGLLILQASSCNAQIPAKLYEYVRAARPVLLLTDPDGDTAAAARSVGIASVAMLDDAAAIERLLRAFIAGEHEGMKPELSKIAKASRRSRTAELAAMLDELAPRSAASSGRR